MPPLPKPVGKRQRTNKPKAADSQIVAMNTATFPAAPAKLSKALRDEWETLWQSELAAHWNQDSDLPAMRRLFGLYERLNKYEREAARDGMVSKGSTGQKTLHPLLKAADTLRSQILALEDRFGLTPMARLKLGIALGEAAASLDDLNKRLNEVDEGAANDEDDDAEFFEVIDVEAG